MKTFALALFAAAASATEWGNPYGDMHSGYADRGPSRPTQMRRGPSGPRYGGMSGPTARGPSSQFGRAAPRMSKPDGPRGYGYGGRIGNAQGIIGDGYGDGYGHGRGFNYDDQKNVEFDMADNDQEFEIEAEMDDMDVEDDLEVDIQDFDTEFELEDRNDAQTKDGQLWNTGYSAGYGNGYGYGGYGNDSRGHGTVRSVGLKNDLGYGQKEYDTAYKSNGYNGQIAAYDNGAINRGSRGNDNGYGYGAGYGAGYGSNAGAFGGYKGASADNVYADRGYGTSATGYTNGYNNKGQAGYGGGYNGMRSNIGESRDNDRYDEYGAGYGANVGYRNGYNTGAGVARNNVGGFGNGYTGYGAKSYGGYGNGYASAGYGNAGYGNVGYGSYGGYGYAAPAEKAPEPTHKPWSAPQKQW